MSALSALGFILAASVKNLLRRQLQRLRQPRYLVATLLGVLYVANLFFNPATFGGPARAARPGLTADVSRGDVMAWVWLLIILFGWISGGDEQGLVFTEPEIQFLFPAPLSRRQIVHYKLVRTLLVAALSALVLTLSLGRSLGSAGPRFFFGAFLGVGTLSIHLVAASLTRLSLLEHGIRSHFRRAVVLLIPLGIVGAIVAGVVRVPAAWPGRWPEVKPYLFRLLETPPVSWAAAPLLPAARIAFARTGAEIARWLPAALAVLALHYRWAIATEVAFEQASIAAAERRTRRIEGVRRGRLTGRPRSRPPFALAAAGHPAMALYWKNLTAAVRVLSLRVVLVIVLPVVGGGVAVLSGGASFDRELGAVLALVLAVSTAIFGVQIYRVDFRLDLSVMDLLKSFPLRGLDVAVAEVMAPFTVLVAAEWVFVGAAAVVAPAAVVPAGRLPAAITAMVALPALTLPGLLVQNAVALIFPAWVESGAASPRGIEAVGQRLLTLVGTILAAAVALLPAAAAGGVTGALLRPAVGSAALPAGAAVFALVVAAESAVAFAGLGKAFDRFDPGQA